MSNPESKSGQSDVALAALAGPRRLGKYDLIARIGEGGMAEVYLARQRGPMDFEKVVVVKTIHPHLGRKRKFIDMLLDEARIAARLKHPCVVDIYDLGIEGETHFIAMEHLAGETLLSVLRACVKKKPLDVPCTARIIADVAEGLHAAHELKDSTGRSLELVHRDITPGNIVVLYAGQVKILDFGIAKARGRLADETDADHFKGKLGYISPEQVKGEAIDRRSDIFSLGVVLWESLALRRLFRKSNPAAAADAILKAPIPPPSKYRSAVPPKLDSICMRALARDPDERYASAADMHEDIERFLAAGSFRPHKAAIRAYMHDVFADRIEEREQILQRVVVATSEFLVPANKVRHNTDSDIDAHSGEGQIVVEMADGTRSVRMSTSSGRAESPPPILGEQLSPGAASLPANASWARSRKLWGGVAATAALLTVIIVAAVASDDGKAAMAADEPQMRVAAGAGHVAGDPRAPEVQRADTADQETPAAAEAAAEVSDDTDAEATAEVSDDTDAEATAEVSDDTDDEATAEVSDDTDEATAPSRIRSRRDSTSRRSPPTTADPQELYDEGIKRFVAGNLSGARASFRAAIKARPSYAAAYRGLGMVYERQGKNKAAADAFRRYLRLAPKAQDSQSIRKKLDALGG